MNANAPPVGAGGAFWMHPWEEQGNSLNQFSLLVELMKSCIDKHGLWPTVIAFVICCLAVSAVAVAWRLPDIIQAIQGGMA